LEYDRITQGGFAQLNATVINSQVSEKELIYEYRAHLNGFDLQFYAKAVKSVPKDDKNNQGGKIYVVTATGQERDWNSQKDYFIAAVDSFELL